MFSAGEKGLGGLMKLSEQAEKMGAPSHWLGYIAVEDVDATVEQAKELGAQVRAEPFDIPGVGRTAILAAPFGGAPFAPFTPAEGSEWDGPESGTPGAFAWVDVMTSDLDGAWNFFTTLFGWQHTESMEVPGGGEYRMFTADGENSIGGFGGSSEVPSHFMFYFTVDDLDAAIGRAKNLGGELFRGPMEVPGGDHIALMNDNQGGGFALHAKG
jgi:predicted enzyme related to lactoylglutathione lyase